MYLPSPSTKIILDWSRANYAEMGKVLSRIDWQVVFYDCTCVDDYWRVFHTIIVQLIGKFVPRKQAYSGNKKYKCKGLKRHQKEKRKTWKIWKKDLSAANKIKFNKATKNLQKFVFRRQAQFEFKLAHEKSNRIFNYVNKKICRDSGLIQLTDEKGSLIMDDAGLCERLSKVFASNFLRATTQFQAWRMILHQNNWI
jgi:hypothetical protein